MTLFLDLDDTLVHSEKAYELGMQALGINPQDKEFLTARSDVKKELPPLAPSARSRFIYFKKYLEARQEYTPTRHLRMIKKYEDSLIETFTYQWQKLNRASLLRELKLKFKTLSIITNEMARMQVLKLTVMDPDFTHFSSLITSEEVGVEKPDPRIFKIAMEREKCDPANSLMVGDTYNTDIEPALKLGMKAIKTNEFKKDSSLPDGVRTILKLEELLAL